MDKKDKKDEIILQQLEVIQTLTEHNLRRMGADFWGPGTPAAPGAPASPPSAITCASIAGASPEAVFLFCPVICGATIANASMAAAAAAN